VTFLAGSAKVNARPLAMAPTTSHGSFMRWVNSSTASTAAKTADTISV